MSIVLILFFSLPLPCLHYSSPPAPPPSRSVVLFFIIAVIAASFIIARLLVARHLLVQRAIAVLVDACPDARGRATVAQTGTRRPGGPAGQAIPVVR